MWLHIIIWLDCSEDNHYCALSYSCVGWIRYICNKIIDIKTIYVIGFNLVWGTDTIFWIYIYMFIPTKWPYLLYLIIISSCCMSWGFIISCALWTRIIRLVLCGCDHILFHVSISILSLDFDICHCLGLLFYYHPCQCLIWQLICTNIS